MSNIQDSNLPDQVEEPPSSGSELAVTVSIDQTVTHVLNPKRIRTAAVAAAAQRGCYRGELAIRVTDDPSIHELNRRHLDHDYATDVLSFGYRLEVPEVEGDVIVSADTAAREAARLPWSTEDELLLYVVHGTLHACGMDDADPTDRGAMREAERQVLLALGVDHIRDCGPDSSTVSEESTAHGEISQPCKDGRLA